MTNLEARMGRWSRRNARRSDYPNAHVSPNLAQILAESRHSQIRTNVIVGVLLGGLTLVTVHDLSSYIAVSLFITTIIGFLVRFNTRIVRLEWEAEMNRTAHVTLDAIPPRLAAIERSLELTAAALEKLQVLPVALERLTVSVEDHHHSEEQRFRRQDKDEG